jgi:hypothetical protein
LVPLSAFHPDSSITANLKPLPKLAVIAFDFNIDFPRFAQIELLIDQNVPTGFRFKQGHMIWTHGPARPSGLVSSANAGSNRSGTGI